MTPTEWRFECDTATFERIKSEESFQQILALARAVNSLQFVISALVKDPEDSSPAASRSRINSFLFGSAILHESLILVERMNQQFGGNETYNQGLRTLLKDPAARSLRQSHMGPARNFAVFHYDPEEFGRMVKSAGVFECTFMTGRGKFSRESYFPFADTLATEVLMGTASSDEDFYEDLGSVMRETRELARRFVGFSEKLISRCLCEWGFIRRTSALH
jgi:hypothetical protein